MPKFSDEQREATRQPIRATPTVAEIEMLRSQDWQRFIDARIECALAERHTLWRDVMGRLIAELRAQWRAEIVEQVGALRADLTVEKAAEQQGHGDVVEVPQFLRGRRDAA